MRAWDLCPSGMYVRNKPPVNALGSFKGRRSPPIRTRSSGRFYINSTSVSNEVPNMVALSEKSHFHDCGHRHWKQRHARCARIIQYHAASFLAVKSYALHARFSKFRGIIGGAFLCMGIRACRFRRSWTGCYRV
jgi:hypothetical protein